MHPSEVLARSGSNSAITLLRGAAVLLVIWDHVVASWPQKHRRRSVAAEIVDRWITNPMVIIQDFGFLGVALFFLVSGYIISDVAVRESRAEFATKRLLRIYPPLIVSILLIVGLDVLRPHLGLHSIGFSRSQTLWAMSLLNYTRAAEGPVNGVAWTLVIELAFYLLVLVALPLLRRRVRTVMLGELAVVLAVVLSAKRFPVHSLVNNWFMVAVSVSYLPVLVVGQAVWAWRTRRSTGAFTVGIAFLSWLLFVLGLHRVNRAFLPAANSYGPSLVLAVAIFLAVVVNAERIRVPKVVAFVAVISYSVYLTHGPVSELVLDLTVGHVPLAVGIVLAIVLLTLVALISWRYVEVPSQRLARWLSGMHERRRTSGERDGGG